MYNNNKPIGLMEAHMIVLSLSITLMAIASAAVILKSKKKARVLIKK